MSCEQSDRLRCKEDKMSQIKWLKCLVVGCNNEWSGHHLLLTSEPLKTQRINDTFALKGMRRSLIYINVSMFKQIIRDPASSREIVFDESLQIAFANNVLINQFQGWCLVCSIDIYIPRCLIIDCFYAPRDHFRNGLRTFEHIEYVRLQQQVTLVYLWIFIDYYGECEMADAATYLERSNRDLHISMICSSLHGREGWSQQSSLAFKETWTRKELTLTG